MTADMHPIGWAFRQWGIKALMEVSLYVPFKLGTSNILLLA
ncbi:MULTISPECIES: hypothetical protein [Bacillus]